MDNLERLGSAYVIVAQPRSGSTLLAHALDAHDSIICHDEIFSEHWVNGYRATGENAGSESELARKLLAERTEDPENSFSTGCLSKMERSMGSKLSTAT